MNSAGNYVGSPPAPTGAGRPGCSAARLSAWPCGLRRYRSAGSHPWSATNAGLNRSTGILCKPIHFVRHLAPTYFPQERPRYFRPRSRSPRPPGLGYANGWPTRSTFRAASKLAGGTNGRRSPVLEMTLLPPRLQLTGDGLIALTGADFQWLLNGRPVAGTRPSAFRARPFYPVGLPRPVNLVAATLPSGACGTYLPSSVAGKHLREKTLTSQQR